MGQVTHYDDKTKIAAAYLYASSGNLSQVSRDTDIPHPTLRGWKDQPVWDDAIKKARQEIGDELLSQNLAIATAANHEIMDRLQNGDHKLVMSRNADGKYHHMVRMPMAGRDAAVVGGIMQDKARVALGLATSIRGDSSTVQALADEFRKLSADHKAIQDSVVSHNEAKTEPE